MWATVFLSCATILLLKETIKRNQIIINFIEYTL
jgi:hypothetical protein